MPALPDRADIGHLHKARRSLLTGALNLFLQYMFTYIEDSSIHDGMRLRKKTFHSWAVQEFFGERGVRSLVM